jgi:UDP-N-acetylglucosamine 2-epimerase (non-hydrolysing)
MPVHRALTATGVDHVVIHSGQHYDPEMSGNFFHELELPTPWVNLNVGSSTHVRQTAAIQTALEQHLTDLRPDWVLVLGDTNTTLAAALTARQLGLRVAHLEAGLRSRNRAMPEELNRVVADHVGDLLLAPTASAVRNLSQEGLADRTAWIGDVMLDAIKLFADELPTMAPNPSVVGGDYVLCTIHRPSNADDPRRLRALLRSLGDLSQPVLLVAHPRLLDRLRNFHAIDLAENTRMVGPQSYAEMHSILKRANALVTDSGGLQKEAYFLSIPCVTVRSETEWEETLKEGWNVLVQNPSLLRAAVERARPIVDPDLGQFGSGEASQRLVEALEVR